MDYTGRLRPKGLAFPGWRYTGFHKLASVVQRADISIQGIKIICTPNNTFYPLDSGLSGG